MARNIACKEHGTDPRVHRNIIIITYGFNYYEWLISEKDNENEMAFPKIWVKSVALSVWNNGNPSVLIYNS